MYIARACGGQIVVYDADDESEKCNRQMSNLYDQCTYRYSRISRIILIRQIDRDF